MDSTIAIPPGDPSNDMRPEKPRPCVGCAGHHGSVGAGFLCLESGIVIRDQQIAKYRAAMASLGEEIERLRKRAVSQEQYDANRQASEQFDRTRGRLKPTL